MLRYALVAAGAALGGMARYGFSRAVEAAAGGPLPLGTLAVNVVGCFAAGAFTAWFEPRLAAAPELRLFVVVGLLGGFTTFSAFGLEAHALLGGGRPALAVWHAAAHLALGLAAVAAGRWVVLAGG